MSLALDVLGLVDVFGNKDVNVSNCLLCICSMRSANWLKIADTSDLGEGDWSVGECGCERVGV